MAAASVLPSRICAEFPIPGVKLTRLQALVWSWFEKRSHLPQGICQAARTMARAFGYCRRSIELAIKFFVDLGLLRRERDYRGLKTRRRFYVVGSTADTPPMEVDTEASAPNSLGANFALTGRNSCAEIDPPPDPPIEVSGEGEEGDGGGDPAPALEPATAAPIAEADPAPPPPESFEAPRGEEKPSHPKATPEQIEAMVAKAKDVLPAQPRGWVLAQARRWTLSWVLAALGRCAEIAAEGRTVKPGLVITILKGFEAEGGPPSELAAPRRTEEEADRIFMEALNRTSWT